VSSAAGIGGIQPSNTIGAHMNTIFALGFVVVVLAALVYLLRVFADWRRGRIEAAEVDRMLNPPEAIIARELGNARRSMPSEEYKKFEAAVFAEIERVNAHANDARK
jgi:hypothetical protein